MNIKKKLLVFSALAISGASVLKAQQDPQYTQFMFNKQMYNPAVTGFDGKHCVSILARNQYASFVDETYTINTSSPTNTELFNRRGARTVTFSYGAPIPFVVDENRKSKNSGGVGLSVYADQAGFLQTNYYKLDLAFKREVGIGNAIGAGINVGAMQKAIDVGGLLYKDPSDPLIPLTINTSNIGVNYGLGFWYNNPNMNNLSVGYALQSLSGQAYSFGAIDILAPGWHQYINASAEFSLPNGMPLKPHLLIKASQLKAGFANPDFNIGALADINQSLQAGIGMRASFRTFESLSAILGYNLNPRLRLGYSFDLNLSRLSKSNTNTHEIVLNYCFDISIPPRPIIRLVDPRHLDKGDSTE